MEKRKKEWLFYSQYRRRTAEKHQLTRKLTNVFLRKLIPTSKLWELAKIEKEHFYLSQN
jgi:hypothetical protein